MLPQKSGYCLASIAFGGTSDAFRFVLDTVAPGQAVHGSPLPLYPNSFRCAPTFTPELSRDLPDGPGCAHESS